MESKIVLERIPFIISVLIILFLIIKDSIKIYGKNKTIYFFLFGIIYSILRANFIGFIMHIKHNISPVLPYEVAFPLFKIFGTTPVEISGWLIVSYLGLRFSTNILKGYSIFHQIVLSSLFIASSSFAIETTAIEGDWWRWKVILGNSIFGKVPTIGIIDWAYVAFDFLFPFSMFFIAKSNIFLKIFSLLIFPLHMIFHFSTEIISEDFPTTFINLFHIIVPLILLFFSIFFKNTLVFQEVPGLKTGNQSMLFPKICTLLIIFNLVFYNLYFVFFKNHENTLQIKLFLSFLPLISFLILDKRFLRIILLISSFVLAIYFKEGIPFLILFFTFYFLFLEKKIKIISLKFPYMAIPFLILLSLSFKEGRKVQEVNKAIEEFNKAYESGLWNEAKVKLDQALSLEPRHPVGNLLMGEYYLKKENNKEKAKFYYKNSLRYYQYFREPYISLIQIYLDEKDINEAEKLFKAGYLFHKNDAAINYIGFRIYKLKGNKIEAEKFLKRARELSSIENMGKLHLYTVLELEGEEKAEKIAWDCLKERKNIEECSLFLWEYYSVKNDMNKLSELKNFMESLR